MRIRGLGVGVIGAAVLAVVLALCAQPASAADEAPHVITRPDWVQKPTADILTRNYPQRAARRDVSGRATIECRIALDGRAEGCSVLSEDPAGYGFGEAAIRVSADFRFRPATIDGKPVAGALVKVPIRFSIPPRQPLFTWPKGDAAPILQLLAAIVGAAVVVTGLGGLPFQRPEDDDLAGPEALVETARPPSWAWAFVAVGVATIAGVTPSLLRRSAGSWTHLAASYATWLGVIMAFAIVCAFAATALGGVLRIWLLIQRLRGHPPPRGLWGFLWGSALTQSGDRVAGGLALMIRILGVNSAFGFGLFWLMTSSQIATHGPH